MKPPKDELLAIENASSIAVADAVIIAILRGDGGIGPHLRALFGDGSLAELARVGRIHGITVQSIVAAYATARAIAAAANPELDRALADYRGAT